MRAWLACPPAVIFRTWSSLAAAAAGGGVGQRGWKDGFLSEGWLPASPLPTKDLFSFEMDGHHDLQHWLYLDKTSMLTLNTWSSVR